MKQCIHHLVIIFAVSTISVLTSCDTDLSAIGADIMPGYDAIEGRADSFPVLTRSVLADADRLAANTNKCYLGSFIDADYGISTTCDYLTKLYVNSGFSLPSEEQIRKANNGELKTSMTTFTVYVSSFMGDSITPLALKYHELDPLKPLKEDESYTASIDPKKYLPSTETLTGTINYTLHDILDTQESSYYRAITDTLDNSFGDRILTKYFENPKSFVNPILFTQNVCPGFYIEQTSGLGAMSEIYTTALHMSFKYMSGDSIVTGVQRIAATDEVIQVPRVQNSGMENLLADTKFTHLRAPIGVFTEVEIPVEDIYKVIPNTEVQYDPFNNARISFAYDTLGLSDPYLQVPQTVMLIAKSKLNEFFETSQVNDYETSFIANNDNTNQTYTFTNISNLITWMYKNKSSLGDDWNKAILLPVTTVTGGANNNAITAVHNSYNTSGARLKLNPKLYIIYSSYGE